MITRPDLQRLVCLCGRTLFEHYGAHNERLSCEQLAERDVAILAARSCTTYVTAQRLLEEGRY